jgi:hypothetical protein
MKMRIGSRMTDMGTNIELPVVPPGQFRIFENASSQFLRVDSENVLRTEMNGLIIEHDKTIQATVIHNNANESAGLILGQAFVIDTGERLSSKHFSNFFKAKEQETAFEKIYETLFGSFAIVIVVDRRSYLYLDSCGCLSAVYSPDLRIAGATAYAILSPDSYEKYFQKDLYSRLDVLHEGWFPSGLTAHSNINRLLCNHRLDLQSFTVNRHWPRSVPVREIEGKELLQKIADTAKTNLNIVRNNFNSAMALTGGYDSRCLLSLAFEHRKKMVTYIVDAKSAASDMDVHVSKKVSARVGINHKVLPLVETPADVITQWHFRSGHAIGGTNSYIHTALAQLDGVEALIEGFGSEVAKGFFWRKTDTLEMPLTAKMVCARFGMPIVPEVVGATEEWLAGIPEGDALFILDLAYLELRMSAWANAQSYVDPPLLHFSPLVSRRSFEAMFRLPIAQKPSNWLTKGIIESHWPELNQIPFNKYGGIRDLYRLARKVTNFRLVKKKLIKMYAGKY